MLLNPYRFVTGPSDPYWSNVVSLVHFNGDEGSTAFVDEKANTWTVNSGTPSNITTSLPVGLQIGATEDFTAECFVELSSFPDSGWATIFFKLGDSVTYDVGIFASSTWNIWVNSSGLNGSGTNPTPQLNTSYHIAFVRHAGNISLFVNGNRQAAPIAAGSTPISSFLLGHRAIPWTQHRGFELDEFRLTKGVARYTENFTPPTVEFPNL